MTSNYCIECGVDMGPSNPRQLCCKTYCDNSFGDEPEQREELYQPLDYEPNDTGSASPTQTHSYPSGTKVSFCYPPEQPEDGGEPKPDVVYALSILEAKITSLEKQVNWLIATTSNSSNSSNSSN